MAISIQKQQQQREMVEALLNSSLVTPEMVQDAAEALAAVNADRSILDLLKNHLERSAGRAATFQPA